MPPCLHCDQSPGAHRAERGSGARHGAPGNLRLAVVTTHPIQYQCPLWKLLAACPEIGGFKVFFASDYSTQGYRDAGFGRRVKWSQSSLDGFDHEFFGHAVIDSPTYLGRRAMIAALERFGPDVCLLNAYLPLMYLRSVAACNRARIPVVLRAETTDRDQRRSPARAAVRDFALRRVYSRISAFASIGMNSRDHYLRLGVPPSRIHFSPYCIDTDAFESWRLASARGRLRSQLGVPAEALVFLFSGKLIPKKDPLIILDALRGIGALSGRPVHAWFLGDGELRHEIERRGAQWMGSRSRVLGFRPQESLADVYADSDVLVLPSLVRETWGLVVNEALSFGIPCVVSDRVGCARDLIQPGSTGRVFVAGDVTGLRAALEEIGAAVAGSAPALAAACRARILTYSSHAAVDGIMRCVRAVAGGGTRLPAGGGEGR